LRTGQAIILAPSGLTVRTATQLPTPEPDDGYDDDSNDSDDAIKSGPITPLGQGYLVVHSRLRITRDGGHSLLAVRDSSKTTRLNRVMGVSAAPCGEWSSLSSRSPAASNTALVPVSKFGPTAVPVSSGHVAAAPARPSMISAPSVKVAGTTSRHVPPHLLPLVHYMKNIQAFGPKWVGRKAVRDHFASKAPQHYGKDKGKVTIALTQATQAHVIKKSVDGIQLYPGYY